ncbi:hypothetical protein [Mesorhizobium sp. M0598]|uniref:hypothetical protein n=1 Tax=unclassified Mesorhizobium TaxID=325217 RepID=UPI00333AA703
MHTDQCCLPDMLPNLSRFVDIEMLRDGGSLTATFNDDDHNHILLLQIVHEADQNSQASYARYHDPVLINCNIKLRPRASAGMIYSELSDPQTPITWEEAGVLIGMASLPGNSPSWRLQWLAMMKEAVANKGSAKRTSGEQR